MSASEPHATHDYPAICRALAAWLLGEKRGDHNSLRREETANRLLEIAALMAQSATVPAPLGAEALIEKMLYIGELANKEEWNAHPGVECKATKACRYIDEVREALRAYAARSNPSASGTMSLPAEKADRIAKLLWSYRGPNEQLAWSLSGDLDKLVAASTKANSASSDDPEGAIKSGALSHNDILSQPK